MSPASPPLPSKETASQLEAGASSLSPGSRKATPVWSLNWLLYNPPRAAKEQACGAREKMGLFVEQQCLSASRMWLLLLFVFLLPLATCADGLGDQDLLESVTCHRDRVEVEFSRELGNYSWHVCIVDMNGEEMVSCNHTVDYERLLLSVPFVNCTDLEHEQHQLRLRLMVNDTVEEETNVTYSAHCNSVHADEIVTPLFVGATNCLKDFMVVTFPGLIPSLSDEHTVPATPMTWTLSIDDGTRVHQLNPEQAMQQGYKYLADGPNLIFQVAFTATGVVSYKHNDKVLHTVALELTYGPPEHRLSVESRMLCAPGPAICNATHMTVAIPAFPGTLRAVGVEDKTIPMDQLQENGIALDTKRGVQLHISRSVLKSRLQGESCSGLQSYMSSLELVFHFHGENVLMVMHPECPCDQHAPIVCTQDGYMDFEILADATTPPLDLDTLRLRDPVCQPAFKSPLSDRVWFHVPLNGCGTRYWFDGDKIVYENEVRALWTDLPLRRISRDSELRLTILCSFSNGDASLSIRVDNLPPPASSRNQGSLSLVLLSYPEVSYRQPYRDDQYPIVRYLRQSIFLEVQVLNRNDPNLHLVLDDCWATASQDPSSLPQWNIVVDGCEYDLDSYKTVFHPVGHGVSYANYRQRLEVKTFAFASGDKTLPGLVYFHCSSLICDRFQPDSPLCVIRCPRSSRSKRESGMPDVNSAVASLWGPVLFVPEGWSSTQESTFLSKEAWAIITVTAVVILSLLATTLLFLAFRKCLRRKASTVNVMH
ncbi:zona pellucida sperm-binding protein 2 isoform X2 [Cuculus canorus]|uniref:zona pellucida sperm-binding protein 2 isoform X2 n=1 Tax=Cuculus canorus TaxID=55661 RepID=UPI0023AA570B|nr:zona pellucida sperm-binding protein 2 isoform X2 [Cuculus canorus]